MLKRDLIKEGCCAETVQGRASGEAASRQKPNAEGRPWAPLVAQSVKNLPAMQETLVHSLGGEDALEKETGAHSSILAGKSCGQRSLGATVHAVASGTQLSN